LQKKKIEEIDYTPRCQGKSCAFYEAAIEMQPALKIDHGDDPSPALAAGWGGESPRTAEQAP
jgi:hypothetical protein